MIESDEDYDADTLLAALEGADQYVNATRAREEHFLCLKSTFGHSAFRPKQWDIIHAIIENRRDVCVVMPTGYGKSLCFQFPSVYTNGITVIVSPLISLMQDQVSALEVANISACFLGSAQRNPNIEVEVLNGDYRLVYASPEYLTGDRGKDLLRKLKKSLTLIAIDEAHCVSQWGHDFRTDYRRLNEIRSVVENVPILAVTATATPQVRKDIAESLRMRNPQFICMGFDRPNIEFNFRPKSDSAWDDLRPYTMNVRGSVIVYVLRRADAEQIAKILQEHGVRCEFYHAGAGLKRRRDILEDFTRDRLQVIVATVAFGMGIDKPDVRIVIHYGVSKNLETYYQEVGRAGRDGQPSKAITFYDKKDFGFHQWLLSENLERKSPTVQHHLQDLAEKMKEFCYTSRCRRAFILEYFGSDASHLETRPDCCDNCKRGVSEVKLSDMYQGMDDAGNYDFTKCARLYLSAMNLTSKAALAIGVLRGSMAKGCGQYKNDKLFGAGKLRPKGYWEAIQTQLKNDHMLTIKVLPAPYRPIVVISPKGLKWLRDGSNEPLILKATQDMLKFIPRKGRSVQITDNNNVVASTSSASTAVETPPAVVMSDANLESILLSIRSELAEMTNCMPFVVASNMAIAQMVQKKPANVKEFKSAIIDGFSLAKIEKFAQAFVDTIAKFMQNEFCIDTIMKRCPLKCDKTTLSSEMQNRVRELVDDKISVVQISKATGLRDDAIIAEIIFLLRSGYCITKAHLTHLVGIDDGIFNHIKLLADSTDLHSLDEIDKLTEKFCAGTKITAHMLELVLNYLRVRQYLELTNAPYFDPDEDKLINAKMLVQKYIEKLAFDLLPDASQIVDGNSEIDGGEFSDEMIDNIFVDWSPEKATENEKNVEKKSDACERKPSTNLADSQTLSQTQAETHTQEHAVLDISTEEDIDKEMLDNLFVDWSQADAKSSKTEALHDSNSQQELPKQSSGSVIRASHAISGSSTALVEVKQPKATAARVFVRSKTRVQYCSDSESEEENQPAAGKSQRSLPGWMASQLTSTVSANQETVPKRTFKKPKF